MDEECKIVSLVECEDYDRERVYAAVKRSIELIGGIGKYVSPGQKVFLKFNMLQGAAPEKCITTHPEIVYAVARILKDHGCLVTMGDSPGSGSRYDEGTLRNAYRASGFEKVAADLGIPLNYGTGFKDVLAPASSIMKRFNIIDPALDADAIVVVSKAKTHALTYMTGAAKNIFGVIPGMEKPAYHARFRNPEAFARLIIDLNDLMKPRLQVVDAVMAMEGDGPLTGSPRKIGAILSSGDYSAMDVIVAKLMAINPPDVGTIKIAMERGYIKKDLSDVVVAGDPLDGLVVKDFKKPSTYAITHKGEVKMNLPLTIVSSIAGTCTPRPKIIADRCIGCGKCERSCPVSTIIIVDKKARINYEKCIKCYCCHEMCTEQAIALERSSAGKMLARLIER